MKMTAVVLLALSLAACKTTEKAPEPPEPATAEAPIEKESEPAAPTSAATANGPEPVRVLGTPYEQEHSQTSVTAKTETQITLHRSPGVTSPSAGTVTLKQGDRLQWAKSWLLVTEPTVLTAKVETLLNSAVPIGADGMPSGQAKEVPVPTGAKVDLLKIGAEGTCVVRFDGTVYDSTCPSPRTFEPKGYTQNQPKHQWWVLVERDGSTGWVRIDDRFEVETSSTL